MGHRHGDLKITPLTPQLASITGGYRRLSSRRIDFFSECDATTIGLAKVIEVVSSRSTIHISASVGTAKFARFSNVAR